MPFVRFLNLNVHPECENSLCTALAHHEQLGLATEQVQQLRAYGPPVAKRRASVGANVSRANNDDDSGDEPPRFSSITSNGPKRRRSNATESKPSDAEIVLSNAVTLINELQLRSGARRPLIAALFDGVSQQFASTTTGLSRSTIQRASKQSRDGKTTEITIFYFVSNLISF